MLKEKTCRFLKKIAEETAKNTVNEASNWYFYQDDEPEEVRRMFIKQKNNSFNKIAFQQKREEKV